jgi:drug/metabolite transporter (DMT)-like permease
MNKIEFNDISSTQNLLGEELEDHMNVNEGDPVRKSFLDRFIEKFDRLKGILLGILAAFFFALFGIFNRKASFVTGSEQSSFRYLIQIVLMIIIANYNNVSILGPKEHRKLLLVRGLFGAVNFISFGFSLKYIDPSDSQVSNLIWLLFYINSRQISSTLSCYLL